MKPRPQCSSCGSGFAWPTTESRPVQLFPLVCGDVLCRSCLAQRSRATLASADLVPLRCCHRAVPAEFVQDVLLDPEFVYYSFLLSRTEDKSGNEKVADNGEATSQANRPSAPKRDQDVKLPASVVKVSSTEEKSVEPSPVKAQTPKQKQLARDARGRFIGNTSPVSSSSKLLCYMCRSLMFRPQLKAPCEHDLCVDCVRSRVGQQLRRDATEYDVGVPVRCCKKLLPLDVVKRVITGQDLANYLQIMAKNGVGGTKDDSTNGTKRKATQAVPPALKRQAPTTTLVLRSKSSE